MIDQYRRALIEHRKPRTSYSNNDKGLGRKYGKDHRAQDRSQQNFVDTVVGSRILEHVQGEGKSR